MEAVIMKKIIAVILAVFITCSLFAQVPPCGGKWHLTREELNERSKHEFFPGFSSRPEFDYDTKLYDFMVMVWEKYFTDYYNDYGVPFSCGYCYKANAYEAGGISHPFLYHTCFYDGSFIEIVDVNPRRNWATYIKTHLDEINPYTMGLICHELVHVVEYLCESVSLLDKCDHNSPTYLSESIRLLTDYGIDIDN